MQSDLKSTAEPAPLQRLTDEELQLLGAWNATRVELPPEQCLHELFEAQVQRTPQSLAVVGQGQSLTYQDLNWRANQLACHLRSLGVGPEKPVGIFMERSPAMVVGLLGILKAGGAYLPLDPAYPPQRLAFMLTDSQVPVVLTQQRLAGIPAGHAVRLVCLDTDGQAIARHPGDNTRSAVRGDNLAYVFYTSGSTGQPKGVAIQHNNCVAFVDWARRSFDPEDLRGVLASTSICFDLSVFELFVPLSIGGQVILVENVLALATASSEITLINTVPSAMAELLRLGDLPASVRTVNVAGEPLSLALADQIYRQKSVRRLFNLYGPTEATTYSTRALVPRGAATPTIGRPIANTQAHVLDEHLQAVPVGVPGELYLGGAGVARGYLHRPELTAEKFIPSPFSAAARLYRTGDRVRWLPGGELEYLGRTDYQVKIRGYRVELGEVEVLLKRHPGVRDAVVVAREHSLIAYAIPCEPAPALSELRRFLEETLPGYMVPAKFVLLDSLPLTLNGKVDRQALPEPGRSRPALQEAFVAPRTPTEEALAEIWAQILGLEQVGIHDNFFELGGDSLHAIQVLARVRIAEAVEVPLGVLFGAPTVAGLAGQIEMVRSVQQSQPAPLLRIDRQRALPLSFAQQSLWFLDRLVPGNPTYHVPLAVRLRGRLDETALEQSLGEIVRRHEILRTTFAFVDGHPVQVIAEAASAEQKEVSPLPGRPDGCFAPKICNKAVPLVCTDLSGLPEGERRHQARELAAVEARRPFDLAAGALLRASLWRLDSHEHVLLLTLHHIVSDALSLRVLVRELAVLYQAFVAGRPSPLADLPAQYADYVMWQQNRLQGDALEPHLSYWKRQLHGVGYDLRLPLDRPRPAVPSFRGACQSLRLSNILWEQLKAFGRCERVTLFMTLLAAFQILLHRYTGQDDIVVGSPVAGRPTVETESLIGLFFNTLVLRTDLSGRPSFRELLARVRQVALGALDHQDLPFDKLIEALRPDRDPTRPPLIQVCFNLEPFKELGFQLPELVAASDTDLVHGAIPQMYDMTLYAFEGDQGILLRLVYNPDLFDAERMAEMLEQFRSLLTQAVMHPEESIDAFSLVTAAARQWLPEPTLPLPPAPWDEAIHMRFSRQASRCPDRPAVLDGQETLTYGALDSLSNRLANALRGSGIGPGNVVAVYAHRGAGLVLAILGILKAGGAFLILDPAFPGQRLADYLRLAKPQGWLQMTAAGELPGPLEKCVAQLACHCRLELPPFLTCPVVGEARGDDMATVSTLASAPTDAPGLVSGPDDLAYIAFTSGSDGMPKGVMGTHGPLAHFIDWHARTFGLQEFDRFSLCAGLSHDPLLREIFTPLSLGATLHIPDREDLEDPTRLAEWLRQEKISIVHLSPLLGKLLGEAAPGNLPSLRYFFFGGDVLWTADVVRLEKIAPAARCVNFYGCTETPQAMSFFIVPRAANKAGAVEPAAVRPIVPIGRGIQDVQLWVLNSAGHLAGVGELGEIYVRTPYLSKGYVGDDALTRERFLENPWAVENRLPERPEGSRAQKVVDSHDTPSANKDRLYKTGDVGRYLPGGDVEFLGRTGRQVKVRGNRVELTEIEAALRRHPWIQENAVLVHDEPIGNQQLLAFLVPNTRPGPRPTVNELRGFLRQTLPEFMIPATFVALDGMLPRTPNGKVDRRALLATKARRPAASSEFAPPVDALQLLILDIWRELLPVRSIGIRDDFFELGGHSLLAVRMMTRIEQVLGRKLPLATLFAGVTIEDLARAILDHDDSRSQNPLVEIQKGDPLLSPAGNENSVTRKRPFVYLHGDFNGGGFYCLNLARLVGPEQPFYVLQPHGLFGRQMPTTIEGMAADHVETLLGFQPEGPYLIGGHCNGALIAFEMAQRLCALGKVVDLLVMISPPAPQPGKPVDYSVEDVGISHPSPQAITLPAYLDLHGLAPDNRRAAIQKIFRMAIAAHRVRPYPGQITILQPMNEVGASGDPSLGWQHLAAKVQSHLIPGWHLTSITTHVQAVAEHLRVQLRHASGESSLKEVP